LDLGSAKYLIEHLNSNNENFRVETLFVLEELSKHKTSTTTLRNH